MRILVIPPGDLPIPAIKGGAIESLVTYLVDENERAFEPYEFVIFNHAEIETKSYQKTRLVHETVSHFKKKIYTFFYKAIRAISCRKIYIPNYYVHNVNNFLKKEKFDLILVEGEYLQGLTVSTNKTPIWLHLHTDLLYQGALRAKTAVEKYDKIICVSEFIRNRVLSIGTCKREKVCVLKNCVDHYNFNVERAKRESKDIKEKLNIQENEKVLLYCGRISAEKGVKELLTAYWKADVKNTKLVIVGASWFSTEEKDDYVIAIERMVMEKKLQDKIVFTGYVNHGDLAGYYGVADCIIVPSICNEAASLVSIEAQACGVPVIANAVGGIPEYVCLSSLVNSKENFVDELAEKIRNFCTTEFNYEILPVCGKEDYYKNFGKIVNGIDNEGKVYGEKKS